MRNIRYIVVHSTGGSPRQTADDIVKFHVQTLDWSAPGYHYIVEESGRCVETWPVEKIANGVKGYNHCSVHVCYTGGLCKGKYEDTRTSEQKQALRKILKELKERFPEAAIVGHRDLSPDKNNNGQIEPCEWIKACPCFDAKDEYSDL